MKKYQVCVALAALSVVVLLPSRLDAQDSYVESAVGKAITVWRIEEIWEVRVDDPDPLTSAPHVTTAISPVGHVDGQHCIVNLNHVTLDYFQPGGVQLQVWQGETPVTHNRVPWSEMLATANEVVTWTQSMTVVGSQIIYQITDGHSDTWGDFGGQGYLTAMVDSPVTNLNQYDPAVSVAQSGVVFAGNRVTSLKLKAVRVFASNGEETYLPVDIEVHQP